MSKYDELKRLADELEVLALALLREKADLIAENGALKELLVQAAAMIRSADVETGVCCCGSPVETHGFGDGHSPVDQGGYYALDLLARIEAATQEAAK